MKATLLVIENESDHTQAKALIEKLMGSKDPADQARMTDSRGIDAGPILTRSVTATRSAAD